MSGAELVFRLFQPSNALAVVFLAGAAGLIRWPRLGAGVLAAAGVLYATAGLLPVGQALLRPLEERFARAEIVAPPDGIVVLGGFIDVPASGTARRVELNEQADRITAAAALARRFPEASVIVSDGPLERGGPSGAALAARLLEDFGIAPERIVLEERARSTWDNARFTRALVRPSPGERYVLVTTAWHMPRAIGAFRRAGWPQLAPWPVDYVDDGGPLWRNLPNSAARGLTLVDLAAREYAALAYYYLRGRTDALVPAPTPR